MVLARDRTGLVHFAVPLLLGEHALGALVAGQVFDNYPEQLPLEHVAKMIGLAPQMAWRAARLEHPVKRATLEVYAGLLATLGQTFLQTRYKTIIENRLAEMTRLRDQLAEADRRKDEFLAILAHELRNPLAAILNAAQLMRLYQVKEPAPQRAIEVVERQAEHMARLLDDLLDISRISRGKIELHKERLDLAAVVREAVQASQPLIDSRRHQLSISQVESLSLEADPTRLVQIITNLLNNAAKYTEPGGHIWISAAREGREAVVRVGDTGVGLDPHMLCSIFEPFIQVPQSLARSPGGLGLGLSMVRRLVQIHGGSVTATSPGPGQGSEFVVRLPLATAPEVAPEVPAETAPSAGCRIVLVEGNNDSRKILGELLRMCGHDVMDAADGAQAIELIQRERPDVAVIDIGLPGLDGYQVAQRVRAEPNGSDVFLVALTGHGQSEDRHRALAAGFDAHLVKPVNSKELSRLLASGKSRVTAVEL